MKKQIKRFFLFLLILFLIVGGAYGYHWYRNRDEIVYETMEKATLPVVRLMQEDGGCNTLHGYLEEMDCKSMRQTVTPLSAHRRMDIWIDLYGREVKQVIYQVRSLDGERLIDDGELQVTPMEDDRLFGTLQLSTLIEDKEEYMLIIMLEEEERRVQYYGRIIYFEDGHTSEMIQFIKDFSDATYSDDPQMIVTYLQPNDTMGMDDLSYINIHSKYRMFTWMGLKPTKLSAIEMQISQISDTQMTAALYYPVSISVDDITRLYRVEEHFVVRWRNDTLYLLDYDRYLTEDFSFSKIKFDNGNIWLGITAEECQSIQSPDGTIQTFAYNRQIWNYDSKSKKMSFVFGYQDGVDERTELAKHDVRLVRTDDAGNIDFLIYGYHNRGEHEGTVGASFMRYNQESRQIDELFFIPSKVSEDIFREDMGSLSYVSDSDLLYLLYKNTLYSLDLTSQEKMELATQDSADGFYRNDQASIAAWHEGTVGQAESIAVMNLENGKLFRIPAEDGCFLSIQGFVGSDLVYGIGKQADIGILEGTGSVALLQELHFVTVEDSLIESGKYQAAPDYIIDTDVSEVSIVIRKAAKQNQSYVRIRDDQMYLNQREQKSETGVLKSSQTDALLREHYIQMNIKTSELNFETETCSFLKDGSNLLSVTTTESTQSNYYVYGKGSLIARENRLDEAIHKAYDVMGYVTNEKQEIIWNRDSRALFKNLMLPVLSCDQTAESLRCCLEIFIQGEGYSSEGLAPSVFGMEEAIAILEEYMTDSVLDLSGCSVSEILYYLHLGHPVLALTGENSAVIICGYETKAITVYDPVGGVSTQMTIEDAEAYFAGLGSRFISCR